MTDFDLLILASECHKFMQTASHYHEYAAGALVISALDCSTAIQTQCPRNSENLMCIKNQAEPCVHLYNNLMQPFKLT